MEDPVEDVADAMVAFLENAPNWDVPPEIAFAVKKHATPEVELEKVVGTTCYVVPFSEAGQRISRGGKYLEKYNVFLMFVRKLSTDFTREKLSKLERHVAVVVRQQRRLAGFPISEVETTVKMNPELAKNDKLFVSGRQFACIGIR